MADINIAQHRIIAAKAREHLLNLHESAMYPYAAYGLFKLDMTAGTVERIFRAKRASEQTEREMELICELFDLKYKVVTDEIAVNAWKIEVPIRHIEVIRSDGQTELTVQLPQKEKQLLEKENN